MLRLPGLGKHGRTKRWDPRTTLVLVALAMLAPVAGAASTVKLSDPLASIQSALHAATNSKPPQGTTGGAVSPIALVIDGQPIDPTATETILRAIDDCRRDGGSVVAICARTARKNNNGAALVALAPVGHVTSSVRCANAAWPTEGPPAPAARAARPPTPTGPAR